MCGCVLDVVLESIVISFLNIGAYFVALFYNGAKIVNTYIKSKTR